MSDTNASPTPAAVVAPKQTKKTIQPLTPARMQLSEHVQAIYVATVENTTTRADLLDPAFWAHVAGHLRPRYVVKVFSDDDSFYAEYLVLSCDKTWAQVHELTYQNLERGKLTEEQLDNILQEYDVQFRGPKKWSVIRKSDRFVLQENMHSKDDAHRWLSVHLNSKSASAAA